LISSVTTLWRRSTRSWRKSPREVHGYKIRVVLLWRSSRYVRRLMSMVDITLSPAFLRPSRLRHSQELHARLAKFEQIANKGHDVHEDVKNVKHILASKAIGPRDRTSSFNKCLSNQGVLHGGDNIIEDYHSAAYDLKTSRVCILGPGGMGKTSSLNSLSSRHGIWKRASCD
jgi:hypothetical protein